jgi:hypothetical protein
VDPRTAREIVDILGLTDLMDDLDSADLEDRLRARFDAIAAP